MSVKAVHRMLMKLSPEEERKREIDIKIYVERKRVKKI